MVLVQGSRHADDDDVHRGDLRIVGGRGEAALAGQLNLGAGNADDVGAAPVEGVDFAGIDVESGYAKACIAEQQSQRQANVAHADNPDAGLAALDLLQQFSGFV